jgi:hypothetical protein
MKPYTYDSRQVIELYITAFGSEPSVYWITAWDMSAPSRKQAIWDDLNAEIMEISG